MDKLKIGIVGAAGYAGGELIRLLLHHPKAEIDFVLSNSQNGKKVSEVHTDLIGETDLVFTQSLKESAQVIFLALPHGRSQQFLHENKIADQVLVIDLSTDFRDEKEDFVYGLTEVFPDKIKSSKRIANPGCFATAIQLALAPAVAQSWTKQSIHVSGITGSTGAGVIPSDTTHFSWRNQNISSYKLFEHQHLHEVKQTFTQLDSYFKEEILFVPYRGNFSRGILTTVYFPFEGKLEDAKKEFIKYYKSSSFVHISDDLIDLKQVVNTNKCLLHLEVTSGQLIITSIIDNLLKGAAGQAVQNMNLHLGWEENLGLQLKANAY
ncbi:N-acetyl-gamma-glutamyl-phosphate reductase [Marivirga tractuosa]|uniref:N-acetyl-gamma-glutamyl-phosphate reductase n=1 Tax=Marivirga tractuosa (strain ATCC 23168 / DSM 4126 / NBRC 15989 / NCIMB 1408 / VKM B-1430 / H-43) TaxID=643867 RepID=E4TPD3_MARTH|nr:N-acetyl-gamma-glutamyl-phosphate reductase [Marivirga tractuosa]ADR21521.1 N-acetyl-gamma-glutamyl-phosphate reductase [Marivirga tractuosa DSM 4126]BDD14025.1 N-acetyl-gamma-glutamyl-phosphate reductase [Marivirga tractuosa]